jgi:DNA-binding Lrp family transcriptional regulator
MLAGQLGCSEEVLLEQIQQLQYEGIIRRLQPVLNYRALGYVSTLVAAHVPLSSLDQVIQAVNALDGVSHNYLRDHHMNLWFTLHALSRERIAAQLRDLAEQFHMVFHNLPAKRMFKLNVRFYVQQASTQKTLQSPVSQVSPLPLTVRERLILCRIQEQWHVCLEPFQALGGPDMDTAEVLETVKDLKHKGVIRRIGAVLDQYKIGLCANVLFAAVASGQTCARLAADLVSSPLVSHCYERETSTGWPYNLYAMIHAGSMDEIHSLVEARTQAHPVGSHVLLPTTRELKKQPIRFCLGPSKP